MRASVWLVAALTLAGCAPCRIYPWTPPEQDNGFACEEGFCARNEPIPFSLGHGRCAVDGAELVSRLQVFLTTDEGAMEVSPELLAIKEDDSSGALVRSTHWTIPPVSSTSEVIEVKLVHPDFIGGSETFRRRLSPRLASLSTQVVDEPCQALTIIDEGFLICDRQLRADALILEVASEVALVAHQARAFALEPSGKIVTYARSGGSLVRGFELELGQLFEPHRFVVLRDAVALSSTGSLDVIGVHPETGALSLTSKIARDPAWHLLAAYGSSQTLHTAEFRIVGTGLERRGCTLLEDGAVLAPPRCHPEDTNTIAQAGEHSWRTRDSAVIEQLDGSVSPPQLVASLVSPQVVGGNARPFASRRPGEILFWRQGQAGPEWILTDAPHRPGTPEQRTPSGAPVLDGSGRYVYVRGGVDGKVEYRGLPLVPVP